MALFLRKDIDSGQVTSEKILDYKRVPYTHEHALNYVLNTHNNTYNARLNKNARKQVKLSGVFVCRFFVNIADWHLNMNCIFQWQLYKTIMRRPESW